jgi:hypothetical protein
MVQLPDGSKLLSVLLLAVFFPGIPSLLIVGVYEYLGGKRGYERRVDELEEE